jgi:hypothetical protein
LERGNAPWFVSHLDSLLVFLLDYDCLHHHAMGGMPDVFLSGSCRGLWFPLVLGLRET